MNQFLNIINETDLLTKDGPNPSAIDSLDISKMVGLSEALEQAIKTEYSPSKNIITSHVASSGLSADSSECNYLGCRLERINQLARFALMYSNKVFLRSFFTKYSYLESQDHLERAKEELYNDLTVLYEIKPLIEQGYIQLYAPEVNICFSCQARQFIGDNAATKLDIAYKCLEKDFLENMTVEAEYRDDEYAFTCNGPKKYFDHSQIKINPDSPLALQKRPLISKKILQGQKVKLSKSLISDLGLHQEYAHDVVSNAVYGLSASTCLNSTYLTENDLHIQFLNNLQPDYDISRRNIIAAKHLSSMVPYIEDVDLKDILKLRRREEEAFIQYRQALNKAMDEFIRSKTNFTEKDAKSLHADVIAPSIAALDIRVSQAKKDLISKPYRSLAGIVGTISFGLLTGLVNQDVSEIIKTMGLLKFGSDLVKDTMSAGDGENAVKNDPFYFLWKVKKLRR